MPIGGGRICDPANGRPARALGASLCLGSEHSRRDGRSCSPRGDIQTARGWSAARFSAANVFGGDHKLRLEPSGAIGAVQRLARNNGLLRRWRVIPPVVQTWPSSLSATGMGGLWHMDKWAKHPSACWTSFRLGGNNCRWNVGEEQCARRLKAWNCERTCRSLLRNGGVL